MKFNLTVRHGALHPGDREYAAVQFLPLAEAFPRLTSIDVVVAHHTQGLGHWVVRVTARVRGGPRLEAGAKAVDLLSSIDLAKGKLARQLRRRKAEAVKDRHSAEATRMPRGGAILSLCFDMQHVRDVDVVAVIKCLSDMYRSLGGDGLVVQGMQRRCLAGTPVPSER